MHPGPTRLHAGKIIALFGGQSGRRYPVPFERGATWADDYADADGPQQVMEAVRRNIYYGATVIKLVADQKPYFYSEEEVRAASQEAHRAGLKLAVHVGGGQYADLVALEKNPLEDLEPLRSIHFVMKEGRVIRFDNAPRKTANRRR